MSWRALREARRWVLIALLADLLLLAAGRRAGYVAAGTAAVCALFFRDPERAPSTDPDAVYAPADGVVTEVVEGTADAWLDGAGAVRVTTFLSVLNVHITRSPVSGRIALEEDIEGSLRPAFLKGAAENRRRRLAVDGAHGRVVLVQVAGSVARTITPWKRISDTVDAGERVGLIHFGSRADVILPEGAVEVAVHRGQRVRAGLTVLARYPRAEEQH